MICFVFVFSYSTALSNINNKFVRLIAYRKFFSSELPDLMTKFYFYGSLAFITIRCFVMLYCTSYVCDITKMPLRYFCRVPLNEWNLELQHFYELVAHNTITLTGKKFFYLKKSVILAVGFLSYYLNIFNNLNKFFLGIGHCGYI